MRVCKMPTRVPPLVALVLIAPLALAGCVAAALTGVAAVAGTTVYENGKETEVHHTSLDRTWDATLATAHQMGLHVESQNKTAQGGTIEAKRADGTPITITEEAAANQGTRVIVRVGTMGDQKASEDIQRGIAAHLG